MTVSPGAVVVTPDPVPSVGNYAAWVFSARGVLDDYVATDGQMLTLGLTLCREVPVSLDRAEELSSGLGPALVGLTAGNVMDLSGVAERTICPGGVILPNPDTLPEPEPAALPSCPTMKQLRNTIRVVSSRKDPTSDYGARIWLVELRFTNPRPYSVYLNGELETKSESGGFLFSPSDSNYVRDLHGLELKPGRSTIRTEVSNADSRLGAIGWDYWAIAPTEHVTDPDARCEQSAST